jgi:hypothetical protein
MRRPAKRISQKLAPDSKRIADLAQAFTLSSSRLEQRFWEQQLDAQLAKLLRNANQPTLEATMNHLFKVDLDAYDALMEAIEAGSESALLDGGREALLIALPILAWTRFAIASSPVPADTLASLAVQLQAHVLADDVKVAMMPMLYSIDQLPRSHVDIHAMLHTMAQAALDGAALSAPAKPPETAPFLADSRYLLAVVVAQQGKPLFRWQAQAGPGSVTASAGKQNVLHAWQTQAAPHITRLLPGCNIELMLPEAYYMACREADKQIRPVSIRAADYYLTQTLNLKSADLHASIGGFGEDSEGAQIDEYRIGFSLGQNPDVVYGIVWPLYGAEDSDQVIMSADGETTLAQAGDAGPATPLEDILSALRESGVVNIKVHDDYFAMEFCDDCGSPLYADRAGELVHAEMPDDAPIASGHLH